MSDHILVTGGAGFIGSQTCKHLSKKGFTPVVVDNLIGGHKEFVKWGPLVECSIDNADVLAKAIDQYKPVAAIHFAAYIEVGESVKDPKKYYRNNVAQTLKFLDCLVEHGVSKLVFSSTAATYGEPKTSKISEDHPQHPLNPYGAGKFFVERFIQDFGSAYGIDSVIFRYFNAAGADPDGEIGEDHDPESHLIPLILDAALGRRESISIFGTDYPTSDGTCVRDFIHVYDLAEAHCAALDYLLKGGQSVALNLGTGIGHTVKDVITTTEQVVGKSIPTVIGDRRDGDPARLVACADKAREVLGWEPACSDLKQIISDAYQWRRTRFL